MNKYITYILISLFIFSCNDFEDINKDPNNPSVVPPELLLPSIIADAVKSMTGSGNRASQYVQHLAWLGGTSESDGRYNLTGASFREEWNAPMRLIKDVNQLKEIAQTNEQPEYEAVAHIMKVYILSMMSDAYGDIPYNEAGMGNVDGLEFANFQHQKDVYTLMLEDLEKANQLIKALPSGTTINRDILYNGNLSLWRKFANSLKVRILMRESQKIDVNSQLAQIFNNPTEYPVFTSNDDHPVLVYNNSTDIYQWYLENPPSDGSWIDFTANSRVSNVMVDMLQNMNDPRIYIYVAPTKNSYEAYQVNSSTALVYRGQQTGLSTLEQDALYLETGLNKDDYSVIGKRFRKENRAFVMTYSELLFLKAEAIIRSMGVTGNASQIFEEAIRASFDRWEQSGQDNYSETPYITETMKTEYFNQSNVSLGSTTALQQIAEQMWIDSYLNGFEGWANWRRTGYPEIQPGPSVLSPIPVRYVYSDNEQNNPNLIKWVKENMGGTMPDHNVKVWFQP